MTLAILLPSRTAAVRAKYGRAHGHSEAVARGRAKHPRPTDYTPDEEALLVTYGPHWTNEQLAAALPGRSIKSIRQRLHVMGIEKTAEARSQALKEAAARQRAIRNGQRQEEQQQ
jgi:hypothetical protein